MNRNGQGPAPQQRPAQGGWRPFAALALVLSLTHSSMPFANSGIRFLGLFQPVGTPRADCDAESILGFSFELQNGNSGLFGCAEDVQVIEGEFGGLLGCDAKPATRALACQPLGATCELLGFNLDGSFPNDSVNPTNVYQSLAFRMAKSSQQTAYVWVKTAPGEIGACLTPFEYAEFQIAVRDSGGPCLVDALDKACEPATPLYGVVRVAADPCPEPAGLFGLDGTVCTVDPPIECRPLRHGRVVLEPQTCPIGETRIPTYEARLEAGILGSDAGAFSFARILPEGDYEIRVEQNGVVCAQSEISIPEPSQPLNIQLLTGPCI